MELLGEGRELRRDEKRWSEGEETMELTDVRRKLGSGEDWRRRRVPGCGRLRVVSGRRRRNAGQLGRREGGRGVKVVAARCGGGMVVPVVEEGNGVEAGMQHGVAAVAQARRSAREEWWARVGSLESGGGNTLREPRSRGEWGKREMEVWGSFYSARGVETMAGRGGNSRRGGVATWARGGGKPAPKFGEKGRGGGGGGDAVPPLGREQG